MKTISTHRASRRGSALLVTLAFLLLLTVLVIGFLTRSVLETQLSVGSATLNKADLAAQGATEMIIADLQAEIVAGSATSTTTSNTGVYIPKNAFAAVPFPVVPTSSAYIASTTPYTANPGLENLLKISCPLPFWNSNTISGTYNANLAVPKRASTIPTTQASLNNRSISLARWNKPLLLAPTSATNLTPLSTKFVAPTWIYVARDGSNPGSPSLPFSPSNTYVPNVSLNPNSTGNTAGTNPVTERYAYAIYDEGGTLDMNVAGSPMNPSGGLLTNGTNSNASPLQPYKNALAYADLTQLPIAAPTSSNNLTNPPSLLGSTSSGISSTLQSKLVNAIVGWRNYASAGVTSGTFPSTYTFARETPVTPATVPVTYQPTPFDVSILGNTTGFLTTGNSSLSTNTNLSDNAFASRQQLIQFLLQGIGQNSTFTGQIPPNALTNLLPYLGTFTRGLDAPSYVPPLLNTALTTASPTPPKVLAPSSGGNNANGLDTLINPSFLAVQVSANATNQTHADGSPALPYTPLVNKRFPLSRLAWITYEGPSAGLSTNDPVIVALENYGIPAAYLKQGTAQNIATYFGLRWDTATSRWLYDIDNTGLTPQTGGGATGAIMRLGLNASGPGTAPSGTVAGSAKRDPDFFELLKAAINVGSIGKSIAPGNGTTSSLPTNPLGSSGAQVYPPNFNYPYETSVDGQIIQIGANIIGQYQPAAFPIRINFNNGVLDAPAGGHEYVSVDNYPYFYGVTTGYFGESDGFATVANALMSSVTSTAAGNYVVIQTPIIWNPHDPNSSMGVTGTYPQEFRVVADSTDPLSVKLIEKGLSGGVPQANILTYTANLNSGAVYSYSSNVTVPPPGPSTTLTYLANGGAPGGGVTNKGGTVLPLTASDSEIDIFFGSTKGAIPKSTPNAALFREPTAVMVGGNRNANTNNGDYSFFLGPKHSMLTNAIVNQFAFSDGSGISGIDNDLSGNETAAGETNFQNGHNTGTAPAGGAWVGFLIGGAPLEWLTGPTSTQLAGGEYFTKYNGTPDPAGGQAIYVTYRMQYLKPGATVGSTNTTDWITYDTKYAAPFINTSTSAPATGFVWASNPMNSSNPFDENGRLVNSGAPTYFSFSAYAVDPRSSRFGLLSHYVGDFTPTNGAVNYFPLLAPEDAKTTTKTLGWVDDVNLLSITTRPDATDGGWFEGPKQASLLTTSYGWSPGAGINKGLYPGFLEQNVTGIQPSGLRFEGDEAATADTSAPGNFYADPDGVVRRAAGGYVPGLTAGESASSAVGLPLARASAYNNSGFQGFTGPSYLNANGLTAGGGGVGGATTAYSIPSGAVGALSQTQSRPYILHRPFRSVAEMGYAFSDTPWRNVDFFTPESGDAALLDVFTLNENTNPTGLEAGKIDLNSRQPYTLAAVLANAYVDNPQIPTALANTTNTPTIAAPSTGATLGGIQWSSAKGAGQNAALAIAQALVNHTSDANAGDIKNGAGPLQNISELVGKYTPTATGSTTAPTDLGASFRNGMNSYTGFSGAPTPVPGAVRPLTGPLTNTPTTPAYSNLMNVYTSNSTFGTYPSAATVTNGGTNTTTTGLAESMAYIQRMHEAPIRALANCGQTRVWNLMIDVIAQTGRFPVTSQTMDQFEVEGERRYWVHVAIDRLTGKILDEQTEVVKE